MSTTQIITTVIAVLVVAAVAAVTWYLLRRRALRERFGPEYDRVVSEQDSVRDAERELRDRERRYARLELRDLTPESRERYAGEWQAVQARFVDEPGEAVRDGHALVTKLITGRGYPTDDQLAYLSVAHARTLGHYRDAHEIYLRNESGEASTEQLRQALVHYRALFADLLGEEPVPPPAHAREDVTR